MAHGPARIAIALLLASPIVTHAWPLLSQSPVLLQERPLKLPRLQPGESCPTSTGHRDLVRGESYIFGSELPWFGNGPVFVALAWKDSDDTKAVFSLKPVPVVNHVALAKTPWITSPSFSGPIVVRGHALDDQDRVLEFDASGTGRRRILNLTAPSREKPDRWSFWASTMWVPGPGCYGIQMDTPSGTDIFVFQAT